MAESELQNVLLQTVGRSHPLLVHFPVALLVVAAVSELGGLWRRSPEVGAMARGLVWFALPATFAAAFAGWTMSERDPVSRAMASTLEWHRWTGVGVLALTLLCAVEAKDLCLSGCALWCHRGCRHWALGRHHELGRGVLVGTHSELACGQCSNRACTRERGPLGKWIRETSRCCSRSAFGGPSSIDVPEETSEPRFKDPEADSTPTKIEFVKDIQPILETYCVECHGPRKRRVVFVSNLSTRRSRLVMRISGPCFLEMVKVLSWCSACCCRETTTRPCLPKAMPSPLMRSKRSSWINEGAHGPGLEHIKRVATKAADERRLDPLGVLEPTEAEQALINGAVAALRDRGAVVQSRGPTARILEVNLSLLRPAANDEHLKLLLGLEPVLVQLDLSRTAVTDEGFAQLAGFPELRDLRLGGTQLNDISRCP